MALPAYVNTMISNAFDMAIASTDGVGWSKGESPGGKQWKTYLERTVLPDGRVEIKILSRQRQT